MRYFWISIVVHLMILNFIWVGFSVSMLRKNSIFLYLGETLAPAQESQNNVSRSPQGLGNSAYDAGDGASAFFSPWLKMRQVEKPH